MLLLSYAHPTLYILIAIEVSGYDLTVFCGWVVSCNIIALHCIEQPLICHLISGKLCWLYFLLLFYLILWTLFYGLWTVITMNVTVGFKWHNKAIYELCNIISTTMSILPFLKVPGNCICFCVKTLLFLNNIGKHCAFVFVLSQKSCYRKQCNLLFLNTAVCKTSKYFLPLFSKILNFTTFFLCIVGNNFLANQIIKQKKKKKIQMESNRQWQK